MSKVAMHTAGVTNPRPDRVKWLVCGVRAQITYWRAQFDQRTALRQSSAEVRHPRWLANNGVTGENPSPDCHANDHSAVGDLARTSAGRALLGLARAVGPSLGGQ